jgi:tetratricopeptide (TPR) repeat protein/predicted Ser/Thr protein kinase
MKPETSALLGQSVGHIRVVDLIGEGGMGAVFVGFDETLERRVALKAIRSEYRLNPQSKARFLREARILSQLDHPRICTIHDYVAEEDSDFLVMELVEGCSLRDALGRGLDDGTKKVVASQLLEVLVEVHGRGVIHRDLKPENIMITPQGTIKVLDFGLSRSADEEADFTHAETRDLNDEPGKIVTGFRGEESTYVQTRLGTILGTAGYMSPEQARGEPATAASDMYSVGLLLQELFTGKRPFKKELTGEELVKKAAQGETSPPAGLSSDLTRLINRLKSLAPGARPSSVDALERFQFIVDKPKRRRRRALVAAVWLALVGLAAGMSLQYVRASREAKRANLEAETAHEVSSFLVDLFEASSPEEARGASFTALQILQRGADRVSEELADQPLTQARLQSTIADVYERMGLFDEAEPLAMEAMETRQQILGEEHLDVAKSAGQLGDLYRKLGDHSKAEPYLKQALEIRERLLGSFHPDVAKSLNLLAVLYEKSSRYAEAEPLYGRALEIQEKELGPDHIDIAMSLTNLAILMARQGEVAESEPLFRRALEIEKKGLGEDHPRVPLAYMNLAIALKMQERYEEAEPLYERAIEIQERVLGPDHPTLAGTIQNLANLYLHQGRYEEAQSLYNRSLEIAEPALGRDHPDVARTLANLAQCYLEQGDYVEAEALYRRSIENQENAFGPDNHEVATNYLNLATLLQETKRYEEAESLYLRTLAIYPQFLDPDHPQMRSAVENYAELLRSTGRSEEASELEAEYEIPE